MSEGNNDGQGPEEDPTMDEAARLTALIEYSLGVLNRIRATQFLTESDQRYARTLERAIARKRRLLRQMQTRRLRLGFWGRGEDDSASGKAN